MGFFSTKELSQVAKEFIPVERLEPTCFQCGLPKDCVSPKMELSGEGRKKILILGEYPTETEDEYGVQFVGESGDYLKDELRQLGISLTRDCWKYNALNCRPKKEPTKKQIKYCKPSVEKVIRTKNPDLILAMGPLAVESLFGDDFSDRTINRWRGYRIPDEKYGCWIVPLFHPVQVIKNEFDYNLKSLFTRDLKRAIATLKLPFIKQKNYEKYVKVLTDFKRVESLLNSVIRIKPKITFDYEATGLKPYRAGMKIVSIGLAVSSTKAFAFPFNYKTFWTKKELKIIQNLWKKILSDPEIKKTAHNLPFEHIWSKVRGGGVVKGWYWDTLLAQHIIDNRSKANGLKFQTFVRYGVRPYDAHIESFLKSDKSHFNKIEKAPFKELLVYNGLDCIFTNMLKNDQQHFLSKMKKMTRAYGFFFKGQSTMSNIHSNGICMDMDYYLEARTLLQEKIDSNKKYLTSGREAKAFYKKYGRDIKVTSNHDLGKLFYDVLGKPPVYTEKGGYKTDKSTIEGLNLPFVDKLLDMKKYEKARGTYLAQFAREVYKGKMNPFFGLIIPKTYRSSSSMPNFQNLPARDDEIMKLIRRCIIPSRGHLLCEADFSGAEVITSVCYHKDKNFYNYLVDPSTDMHRDNASDLLMLPEGMLINPNYSPLENKLAKMIRFFAKNNWTFAQFYGDWFGSCGELFWNNVVKAGLDLPNGLTARQWLETKGIFELGEIGKYGPTPGSFLEHCKNVEEKMWNERFPEYTQWKKDIVKFYQKYGYIETFFGFRFQGYMDKKQCCNYPIQGTSFHLLVYTLIEIERFIKRHKLRTKLIGQIHDSVIADVHKDEVQFYLKGLHDIVVGLQNKFKWLIVPMEIEADISRLREDGGNFSDMRKINPLNVKLW